MKTKLKKSLKLSTYLASLLVILFICFAGNVMAEEPGQEYDRLHSPYTISQEAITIEKDGQAPTPEEFTGWEFKGWWTAQVDYAAWWSKDDSVNKENAKLPDGFTKDPTEDNRPYEYENKDGSRHDWWTWLLKTDGEQKKVEDLKAGDKVYPLYKPTICTIKLHWNGYQDSWGTLDSEVQYGMPITFYHAESTELDPKGWVTEEEEPVSEFTPAKSSMDLYATYGEVTNKREVPADVENGIRVDRIYITTNKTKIHPGNDLEVEVHVDNYTNKVFGVYNADTKEGRIGIQLKVTSDIEGITGTPQYISGTNKFRIPITGPTKWTDENLSKGKVTVEATVCGKTDSKTVTTGHDITWTKEISPTCQAPGYLEERCGACGLVNKRINPDPQKNHPRSHSYAYVTNQVCGGTTTVKTCNYCGYQETTTENKNAQHDYALKITLPATCSHEGQESEVCKKCGFINTDEPNVKIPKTNTHTFGAWDTVENATYDHTGLKIHACTECGKTVEETIPKLTQSGKGSGGGTGSSGGGGSSSGGGSSFGGGGSSGGSGSSGGGGGSTVAPPASSTPETPSTTAVTGVKISQAIASVKRGSTLTLSSTVEPANASNKKVSWSSSNPLVASVSSSGTVTGVKAGSAKITVKTEDGGKTASCTVTVTEVENVNPQPEPEQSEDADNGSSDNSSSSPSVQPSPQPTPTPAPDNSATNNQNNPGTNNQSQGTTSQIYRLYLPGNNEHLYTSDANEAQALIAQGWSNENVGWNSPATGEPVYRLYSPVTNEHHYTKDTNEVSVLSTNGWQIDNGGQPLFYSGGDKPIYRLYHEGTQRHHLTTDENEYNTLGANGWNQEDIALYSLS